MPTSKFDVTGGVGSRRRSPGRLGELVKARWSYELDPEIRLSYRSSQRSKRQRELGNKYNSRDTNQCRQRWRKSLQPGLVKGNWTKEEDAIIRWSNELYPELRKGVWTKTEMDLLNEAQKELGNKWAAIAQRIPGRSENSCKNRWYNAKTSLSRFELGVQAKEEILFVG